MAKEAYKAGMFTKDDIKKLCRLHIKNGQSAKKRNYYRVLEKLK